MEKRILFLITCLLFSVGSLLHAEKIKGNGNIVTKNIQVTAYKQIRIASGVECSSRFFNKGSYENPVFNYSQTTGSSSLSISMDENLFSHLKVQSDGGELSIGTERGTTINPSKLVINGSSKELVKIAVSGCIDFTTATSFTSDVFEVNISGASDVKLNHSTTIGQFNIRISGAGDLVAENLTCGSVDCSVSGAGDISMKGKSDKAKYTVSGSGDIKAFDFVVKDLECRVSGSGDARLMATETLTATVSGTGDIYYKGNAKADTKVSGMGDIRKVND